MSLRRPDAAEKALLWLMGIALTAALVGAGLRKLVSPAFLTACGPYSLLLIAQELLLYGLPALLMRPEDRIPTPRLPRETELPRGERLGAIAGTAALHQLALSLVALVWGQLLAFGGLSVHVSQTPLPQNLWEGLLALAAYAALPALCEESLFRGRLLPGLQMGFSPRGAFWLTSLCFALMHGRLVALPSHLAAGLMLTALCLKDGLGAAVAYHFVFNAVSLGLGLLQAALNWQALLMGSPPLLMALIALLILLGLLAALGLLKGLRLCGGGAAGSPWYLAGGLLALLLPAYLLEMLPA